MVLEETLLKYGVFGLWTISNLTLIWYLLKAHREDKKDLLNVVSNNTRALTILEAKIKSNN